MSADNNTITMTTSDGDDRGHVIWAATLDAVRSELDAAVYGKWVVGLEFVAEVNGVIQIAANTGLQRDRVRRDYLRSINTYWAKLDPRKRRVEVGCWADMTQDIRDLALNNRASYQAATETEQDETEAESSDLVSSPVNALSFNNLVVGESNRVASTLARKIARGEDTPSSMVFLYGRHGAGKTHMLQAIEHEMVINKDSRKVLFMSAEEFMVAFVEGVRRRDTTDLKAKLRSADVLLIDDLQAIAGMGGTQKEFFANIRAVAARGGQVVVTADESPSEINSLSSRVRDELQGGVSIEVGDPDDEMCRRIVQTKARMFEADHPDFVLSDEAVELIVSKVRGPGRQLYGAVCNIFTATVFVGEPVTLEEVSSAIRRQLGDRKPPSIDDIKRAAMATFDISKTEIESARRSRTIAYPRQIAMFLCRKLTTRSFPQIGRFFGGRDHTTVLYAVRKIEQLMDDDLVRHDIERVERALEDIRQGR